MHTCTDMVSTNHVIPQEGKDTLLRSVGGVGIKIEIGRRHGKFHIVDIESTHDSPKVLITCLLKLKVVLLHVPHTIHCAKADGDHWRRDSCAARGMAARTFPRRVQAQIAWRDTQCKKIVCILINDTMKASHESIILEITREQASFLVGRAPPCSGVIRCALHHAIHCALHHTTIFHRVHISTVQYIHLSCAYRKHARIDEDVTSKSKNGAN